MKVLKPQTCDNPSFPLLRKRILHVDLDPSRSSAPLTRMLRWAAWPVPTMIAVGVARPSAVDVPVAGQQVAVAQQRGGEVGQRSERDQGERSGLRVGPDVTQQPLHQMALRTANIILDDREIEKDNSQRYGYGVAVFERSLAECLTACRGPLADTDRQPLRDACAPIRAHQVELIDGVGETVRALSQRHRLFLLTKGEHTEQTGKIEASGLEEFFADIAIVPEKEPSVYRDFLAHRALPAETTWMIGNSPRSDICPALEAGLGAVLVPHPMTWSLEHRDLGARLCRLRVPAPAV